MTRRQRGFTVIETVAAIGIIAVVVAYSLEATVEEAEYQKIPWARDQIVAIEEASREYWRYEASLTYGSDFYEAPPSGSTDLPITSNVVQAFDTDNEAAFIPWAGTFARWPNSIDVLVDSGYLAEVIQTSSDYSWPTSPWGTAYTFNVTTPTLNTGRDTLTISIVTPNERIALALQAELGARAQVTGTTVSYTMVTPLQAPFGQPMSAMLLARNGTAIAASNLNMNGHNIQSAVPLQAGQLESNYILRQFSDELSISTSTVHALVPSDAAIDGFLPLHIASSNAVVQLNDIKPTTYATSGTFTGSAASFFAPAGLTSAGTYEVTGDVVCDGYGTSTTHAISETTISLLVKNWDAGVAPEASDLRLKENVSEVRAADAVASLMAVRPGADSSGHVLFSAADLSRLGISRDAPSLERHSSGRDASMLLWSAVAGELSPRLSEMATGESRRADLLQALRVQSKGALEGAAR